MIIKTCAYPRAALIGNPSDGYYGKTIAFTFNNFQADITLYQTSEIEILPGKMDQAKYISIEKLLEDVNLYGYYGGIRLIKASIKRFCEYCERNKILLEKKNFTIRYHTSIPRHLGLAGSSAIITACVRALCLFYGVAIPNPLLANLILAVETEELHISAGLQDRVAQVYEGAVYMDFNKKYMEENGSGIYKKINDFNLPLFIAYKHSLSEGSEKTHDNLRYKFENGDRETISAMEKFAAFTDDFINALNVKDYRSLNAIINANFDLRKSICEISPDNLKIIQTVRAMGYSAKFTGSGGAVIGLYNKEEDYVKLKEELEKMGIEIIKPVLAGNRMNRNIQ